jgi:peptide/nickel transport system substrate-binding protein
MESRRSSSNPANHYRVQMKPGSAAKAIYLNQHSRDDRLRPLLQDRRFRIALSLAVDRQEINELCFMGVSSPSNAVTTPYDPYYVEALDTLHTQYDPRRAEALLDEVGLHRGDNGMRQWPDGEPFREILHVFPEETGDAGDVWQLVVEQWRDAGLAFVVRQEDRTLGAMSVRNGNCDFWGYGAGGVHWELDGNGRAPIAEYSYYAPLYGRYFATNGAAGVRPPPAHQQLVDWYLEMKSTASSERRHAIGQQILREWAQQCYLVGICRRLEIFIVTDRFRNVPDNIISDYRLMSPGYIGIEQFWIDQTSN